MRIQEDAAPHLLVPELSAPHGRRRDPEELLVGELEVRKAGLFFPVVLLQPVLVSGVCFPHTTVVCNVLV